MIGRQRCPQLIDDEESLAPTAQDPHVAISGLVGAADGGGSEQGLAVQRRDAQDDNGGEGAGGATVFERDGEERAEDRHQEQQEQRGWQ